MQAEDVGLESLKDRAAKMAVSENGVGPFCGCPHDESPTILAAPDFWNLPSVIAAIRRWPEPSETQQAERT